MSAFDNVKLEKGLYSAGNFTKALESLDPSENYKGTPLEGLDAYQRQLKRFGIRVGGVGSDIVDKFFACSDSAVLFPEYVSRAVKQGLEQADILPGIVATATVFNGLDYRSISSVPTDEEKELKVVKEGAFIPETNIRMKENLVKLRKRGRALVASYEAVRYQRLDLFTVTLRQIGAYIARTLLGDAIDVLENGDGNGNGRNICEFLCLVGAERRYAEYSEGCRQGKNAERAVGIGVFAINVKADLVQLKEGEHTRHGGHLQEIMIYRGEEFIKRNGVV